MRTTSFRESNAVLTGCGTVEDLKVYRNGEVIISKWRMSWRERLSALIFGTSYLYVKANKTHPPVAITVAWSVFGEGEQKAKAVKS